MDTLSICICFLFVVLTHLSRNRFYYTLSKCPGDHRIPYRGLKPNSKSSAGKYEKNKAHGFSSFSTGELTKVMFKKCRDSLKRIATMARIQSTRETSPQRSLMSNCKTFYSHVFVFVEGSFVLVAVA